MKKWHMEGIIILERRANKLEIPRPGQRTLWSGELASRSENEFFLLRMMRAVKERVQRQS